MAGQVQMTSTRLLLPSLFESKSRKKKGGVRHFLSGMEAGVFLCRNFG